MNSKRHSILFFQQVPRHILLKLFKNNNLNVVSKWFYLKTKKPQMTIALNTGNLFSHPNRGCIKFLYTPRTFFLRDFHAFKKKRCLSPRHTCGKVTGKKSRSLMMGIIFYMVNCLEANYWQPDVILKKEEERDARCEQRKVFRLSAP